MKLHITSLPKRVTRRRTIPYKTKEKREQPLNLNVTGSYK